MGRYTKQPEYRFDKFMCPLCGQETIPIIRTGKIKPAGHRKWLYCPWCRKTVNTYECRTTEELLSFQERFYSGEIGALYAEEIATLNPKYQHN